MPCGRLRSVHHTISSISSSQNSTSAEENVAETTAWVLPHNAHAHTMYFCTGHGPVPSADGSSSSKSPADAAAASRALLLKRLVPQLDLTVFLSGHPAFGAPAQTPAARSSPGGETCYQSIPDDGPGPASVVPRFAGDVLWAGAALSVGGLSVGLPLMSFTPQGWSDSKGMMYFVSDGFRKHNLEATVLLMVCTPLLLWSRCVRPHRRTKKTWRRH